MALQLHETFNRFKITNCDDRISCAVSKAWTNAPFYSNFRSKTTQSYIWTLIDGDQTKVEQNIWNFQKTIQPGQSSFYLCSIVSWEFLFVARYLNWIKTDKDSYNMKLFKMQSILFSKETKFSFSQYNSQNFKFQVKMRSCIQISGIFLQNKAINGVDFFVRDIK